VSVCLIVMPCIAIADTACSEEIAARTFLITFVVCVCRVMRSCKKIGEGTYAEVFHIRRGRVDVALKVWNARNTSERVLLWLALVLFGCVCDRLSPVDVVWYIVDYSSWGFPEGQWRTAEDVWRYVAWGHCGKVVCCMLGRLAVLNTCRTIVSFVAMY
jgi:hypothetical protein